MAEIGNRVDVNNISIAFGKEGLVMDVANNIKVRGQGSNQHREITLIHSRLTQVGNFNSYDQADKEISFHYACVICVLA